MKKLRKIKNHTDKFENFMGIWFFDFRNNLNECPGHIMYNLPL